MAQRLPRVLRHSANRLTDALTDGHAAQRLRELVPDAWGSLEQRRRSAPAIPGHVAALREEGFAVGEMTYSMAIGRCGRAGTPEGLALATTLFLQATRSHGVEESSFLTTPLLSAAAELGGTAYDDTLKVLGWTREQLQTADRGRAQNAKTRGRKSAPTTPTAPAEGGIAEGNAAFDMDDILDVRAALSTGGADDGGGGMQSAAERTPTEASPAGEAPPLRAHKRSARRSSSHLLPWRVGSTAYPPSCRETFGYTLELKRLLFSRAGRWQPALEIWTRLESGVDRGVVPSLITFNTMLLSAESEAHIEWLFDRLAQHDVRADAQLLGTAVRMCGKVNPPNFARATEYFMTCYQDPHAQPTIYVWNMYLRTAGVCGEAAKMEEIYAAICSHKIVVPDVVTAATIALRHPDPVRAKALLEDAGHLDGLLDDRGRETLEQRLRRVAGKRHSRRMMESAEVWEVEGPVRSRSAGASCDGASGHNHRHRHGPRGNPPIPNRGGREGGGEGGASTQRHPPRAGDAGGRSHHSTTEALAADVQEEQQVAAVAAGTLLAALPPSSTRDAARPRDPLPPPRRR